jgi:predicted Zn-dependent protease with MMP-like domain
MNSVPEQFRPYLDTVQVIVAAEPSRMQRRTMGLRPRETLYGLYDGIPLPERLPAADGSSGPMLPSVITVFRRPLAADFPDGDDLRREVRRTVFHELAHHFGIDDERLEELGAY